MTPDASIAMRPTRLDLSATGNPDGWPRPPQATWHDLPGSEADWQRLSAALAAWKP
jgi:hypothetical protein